MASQNPFRLGFASIFRQLFTQKWQPPFVTNILTVFALLLALGLLVVLYPTLGLCMYMAAVFLRLIQDTAAEMKEKPPSEQVGLKVAIGVYVLAAAFFGFLSLPLYLIGYICANSKMASAEQTEASPAGDVRDESE